MQNVTNFCNQGKDIKKPNCFTECRERERERESFTKLQKIDKFSNTFVYDFRYSIKTVQLKRLGALYMHPREC